MFKTTIAIMALTMGTKAVLLKEGKYYLERLMFVLNRGILG